MFDVCAVVVLSCSLHIVGDLRLVRDYVSLWFLDTFCFLYGFGWGSLWM